MPLLGRVLIGKLPLVVDAVNLIDRAASFKVVEARILRHILSSVAQVLILIHFCNLSNLSLLAAVHIYLVVEIGIVGEPAAINAVFLAIQFDESVRKLHYHFGSVCPNQQVAFRGQLL